MMVLGHHSWMVRYLDPLGKGEYQFPGTYVTEVLLVLSHQVISVYSKNDAVKWELPTIRGHHIDPQTVELLLSGQPGNGPKCLDTAISKAILDIVLGT